MPPRVKPPTGRRTIADQLRESIEASGLTAYALGRDAEVDPGVIQRFLNCERDVRLDTAARLASALGLRLVETARGRGRPSKPARGGSPSCQLAEDDRQPPVVEAVSVDTETPEHRPSTRSSPEVEAHQPPPPDLDTDVNLTKVSIGTPADIAPEPVALLSNAMVSAAIAEPVTPC